MLLLPSYVVKSQLPSHQSFAEDQFKGIDIYDVIQDNNNHYYFATNQGIFLHDGYSYEKISCDQMKGKSVFGFTKDSKGSIYCYNLNQQIFRINNQSIELYYEIPKEMEHHNISIVIDFEDNLLVQSKGLTKISPNKKSITQLKKFLYTRGEAPINLHLLPDSSILSMSSTLKLVINKNEQLSYFQCEELELYKDIKKSISLNFITIKDKVYAIESNKKHVLEFDIVSKRFNYITTLHRGESVQGLRLYITNNQIWLVGNSNGAYVYDLNFNPLYNGDVVFPNKFISDIYINNEGSLVLSTFGEGAIFISNLNTQQFSFLRDEKVRQITSDYDSTIFVGTNQGNIYSIKQNRKLLLFTNPENVKVEVLGFWKEQSILAHSMGNGARFSKWDGVKLKEIAFRPGSFKNSYFSKNIAYLSFNHGVEKYAIEGDDSKFEKIPYLQNRSYCVAHDEATQTIYTSTTNGVQTIDKNDNLHILKFNQKPIYSSSIVYGSGNIFIATRNNGILIYVNNKLLKQIPFPNSIQKIEIHNNNIFILSNRSLYTINRKNHQFKRQTKAVGISMDNVIDFHILQNKLYITNSESVESIPLTALFKASKIFPIEISKVLVNNKINWSSNLSANQRKIEFTFKVSTLRYRDNIKYRYKLTGYDTAWQEALYSQNRVTYNALSAGNYRFVVQSLNQKSLSEPATYSFSIAPPIYQTWWFISLAILLFGATIALIFLFQIKRIRKKNKEKLENQQIQKDLLESELKALRSQMNPHFIFNSLNSIQDLILREDKESSYDYIVLFAKLVRNTLNYSNTDFIPIDKELEFLDVYLSLEKLRFGDNFEYSIQYEGAKDINVPSMLVQPFIENALVHGLIHKKGLKKLDITFIRSEGLTCTVIDNGIGRTKANEIQQRQRGDHSSFALTAIEQRLKLLNLQLGGEIGKYKITDLYEDGDPVGTKVEINIPFRDQNRSVK